MTCHPLLPAMPVPAAVRRHTKLVKYWSEGVQKNIFEDAERDENGDTIFTKNQATGKFTYKTVKRQASSIMVMENMEDDPKTMAYPATEWDMPRESRNLRSI